MNTSWIVPILFVIGSHPYLRNSGIGNLENTISYKIKDLHVGDVVESDGVDWSVVNVLNRGKDRLRIYLKNGETLKTFVFYKNTIIDDDTFGDL